MKLQELKTEELKHVNGGSLLGGDDSMIKLITEGYVNISNTDKDGDTSSTHIGFGSGSMFQNESD